MKEEIETLVNRLYKEWLKTNDNYENDFEGELESLLPHIKFSYNTRTREWLIINS